MEHLFYISHTSNGFLNSSSFNQHSEIGTILHPFRWSKGLRTEHSNTESPATQELQETWVQSLGWEDPLE